MFIQRQFSTIAIPGDDTSASAKGMSEKVYDSSDTYPANILVIDDNCMSHGTKLTGASSNFTLLLPYGYSSLSTSRLLVFITADQDARVTVTHVGGGTDVFVMKAFANSEGVAQIMVNNVTSIVVRNTHPTDMATIKFFIFQYPADLDSNDAWRSGSQTTGVL